MFYLFGFLQFPFIVKQVSISYHHTDIQSSILAAVMNTLQGDGTVSWHLDSVFVDSDTGTINNKYIENMHTDFNLI